MDRYKYSVDLRYIKQKQKISQKINPEHIQSIIIDRDYINNNLPLIYMTITLDKKIIDDMIKNIDNNTMVLRIYKFLYREGKQQTKTKYIDAEMMYFLSDDLNYRASLDFTDKESNIREDVTKTITIGLMGLDSINNNKRSINTVLRNTTMMNAVYHCTSKMNMVIERFNYNETMRELLIRPVSTVSKAIEYLNGIKVFYKTPYRFFIDFDCGYLLSSSGKSVPKKNESINTVMIIIQDPLHQLAMEEGMITNHKSKNYQINVSAADTQVSKNKITEKLYTAVSSISETGQTKSKNLKVNKSKYSKDKTEVVRTPNSNPNLIENISASTNQGSVHISLNKVDVDLSVFTPNKRYIIKNYDGHNDKDGDFILLRKRDLLFLDSGDSFTGTVMLEFDKVAK